MLARETVLNVLAIYGEAWRRKDPYLIATIFTDDAVYHEQVISAPIIGKRNIHQYWQRRVVRGQDNIEFKILNVYIDANTAVAEWEVRFDVLRSSERRYMREVAILEFKGNKIRSLREYWASKIIAKQGKVMPPVFKVGKEAMPRAGRPARPSVRRRAGRE